MPESEAAEVSELLESYDRDIEALRPKVLALAEAVLGQPQNVHSFHGKIGSGYRRWADVENAEFSNPDAFVRRWLQGVAREAQEEISAEIARYGQTYGGKRAARIARLISEPEIWEYVKLFHERNFYRYLPERTRKKPDESLWSIWFGLNQTVWGLLIAPDWRNGSWRNDVSEIRKTDYEYWTTAHAIAEGFINPASSKPHSVGDLDGLVQFYENILKRLSSSVYEQGIVDRYIAYLSSSSSPLHEPLLIPEIRYAGLEHRHIYRLDFAVLNPYSMVHTGFELSPHSTHMSISGISKKTQTELNAELSKKWGQEMSKRREYFHAFGIRVDTFTDGDLSDLDQCFKHVQMALEARPEELPSAEASLEVLRGIAAVP